MAGLEPARLTALPPQLRIQDNPSGCALGLFSSENESFSRFGDNPNPLVQTPVLTKPKKRGGKRFQRVANGLYRFKRTGTLYAVFKVNGRTRWKSLSTDNVAKARLLLGDEIKNAALTDWRQAATLTIEKLVEMHAKNPMGLASSTLKIRVQLLDVFKRTWPYGFSMKVSDVKPIMLKAWLAESQDNRYVLDGWDEVCSRFWAVPYKSLTHPFRN